MCYVKVTSIGITYVASNKGPPIVHIHLLFEHIDHLQSIWSELEYNVPY